MPLRKSLTRTFYRCLYAGQLRKIRYLKRDPDQRAGVVTAYILFNCRKSGTTKVGEAIAGDETAGDTTVWHIPRFELDRVGINYVSALDRIEDIVGGTGTWQPEAPTPIYVKLFANMMTLNCVRLKGGLTAGD